jgi:hypothetical protein
MDNSSFEDQLMETCEQMCQTPEEKIYLAKSLIELGYEEDAAQLYLEAGDEEKYLAIKRKHLNSSHDYVRLAEYHKRKGNDAEATSYIEEAIAKFKDSNGDLLALHLFDYHSKHSEPSEVEALLDLCNSSHGIIRLQEEFLQYFKKRKNYEKTKECILELFKGDRGEIASRRYYEIKSLLTPKDWSVHEPSLFKALESKDYDAYLKLCLKKGMKEEVLEGLMKGSHLYKERLVLVKGLIYDYPAEMLEMLVKSADSRVGFRERSAYVEAVEFLDIARKIQVEILKDEAGWKERIGQIRMKYKTLRSFQQLSFYLLK